MGLTEENSKVFWPLYDQYAAEVKLVWTKRIEIVREYAEKVATIDDATAKTLMDRALMNDAEKTTLRINWSKKMVKSLPATVVARFFQIDSQLDHLISAQIADEVPLMPAAK